MMIWNRTTPAATTVVLLAAVLLSLTTTVEAATNGDGGGIYATPRYDGKYQLVDIFNSALGKFVNIPDPSDLGYGSADRTYWTMTLNGKPLKEQQQQQQAESAVPKQKFEPYPVMDYEPNNRRTLLRSTTTHARLLNYAHQVEKENGHQTQTQQNRPHNNKKKNHKKNKQTNQKNNNNNNNNNQYYYNFSKLRKNRSLAQQQERNQNNKNNNKNNNKKTNKKIKGDSKSTVEDATTEQDESKYNSDSTDNNNNNSNNNSDIQESQESVVLYQFSMTIGNNLFANFNVTSSSSSETETKEDTVDFGSMFSTKMLPPPVIFALETNLTSILPQTETITLEEQDADNSTTSNTSSYFLTMAGSGGVVRFRKVVSSGMIRRNEP